MPKKQQSKVDIWLTRETVDDRKLLESASRYFDQDDALTVNTLEALYGQESSFGTIMGARGSKGAAGYFQFKPATAKQYGLSTTKDNDQRFDKKLSFSAAAKCLKDMDRLFSRPIVLGVGNITVAVQNKQERKKFALAAYNIGQGRVSTAQNKAEAAGKNPQVWDEVKYFLNQTSATKDNIKEVFAYVPGVLLNELEFTQKSLVKNRKKSRAQCVVDHWITKGGRRIPICE